MGIRWFWIPSEEDLGKVAYELWHRHVPPTKPTDKDAATTADPETLKAAWIKAKYVGSKPIENTADGERALAYVDRVVERTINKGRGVLPFNSILLAITVAELATAYERSGPPLSVPMPQYFVLLSILAAILLLISSALILLLFRVRWEKDDQVYGSYFKEFVATVKLIKTRSWQLQVALLLSGIGLLALSAASVAFYLAA